MNFNLFSYSWNVESLAAGAGVLLLLVCLLIVVKKLIRKRKDQSINQISLEISKDQERLRKIIKLMNKQIIKNDQILSDLFQYFSTIKND